jgi:hypothetical protein
MCADIVTKHFTNLPKWQQVMGNIAHVNVKSTWGAAAGQPAPKGIAKTFGQSKTRVREIGPSGPSDPLSGSSSGFDHEDDEEDRRPGTKKLRDRDDYPDEDGDDPSDHDRPGGSGNDKRDDDPVVDLKAIRERMRAVSLARPAEVKEADTVKVPPLPNPQQYRAWRSTVRNAVTAASGRGEEAFKWILQAEKATATLRSLADSRRFDSLDAKLAAALTEVASGELGRRINLAVELEASKGKMLKGRQILWMVHDHHKLDEERGALYNFQDLMSVKLRGDANLESFMITWESVLSKMHNPPSQDIVEVLFLEQLRQFCGVA